VGKERKQLNPPQIDGIPSRKRATNVGLHPLLEGALCFAAAAIQRRGGVVE